MNDFIKRISIAFHPILFGSSLFVQYCIDSYLRIESNNLNWLRSNQKKLKAEEYKTLADIIK